MPKMEMPKMPKVEMTKLTRLPCELARQPSPPGIRLRRSRWRTGKARRLGARAGKYRYTEEQTP
jgi:hypothetical protein